MGDWPISDQPVEAKIWLLGSGEGIRKVPAEANLGKEVTVSPVPGSDENPSVRTHGGMSIKQALNMIDDMID